MEPTTRRTHPLTAGLVALSLLLQVAFPALAAPLPARAVPSTALFPPWYVLPQSRPPGRGDGGRGGRASP
jgi:hypothetical protein